MVQNYLMLHHFCYGTDIVFTYGPLGFLATRIAWGIPVWIFLLTDVVIVCNFFMVFRDFIAKSSSWISATLCCVLLLFLWDTNFGIDLPWVILFFIYYWLYRNTLQPSFYKMILLCFLIVVSFLLKLNAALFGSIFMLAHVALMAWKHQISIGRAIFVITLMIGLILAACQVLNVSLPYYITQSLELVNGYNNMAYLDKDNKVAEDTILGIFIVLSCINLTFAIMFLCRRDFRMLLFPVMNIMYLFVLRKQSIVRDDPYHLKEFIEIAPLLPLYFIPDIPKLSVKRLYTILILILIGFAIRADMEFRDLPSSIRNRFTIIRQYLAGLQNFKTIKYEEQRDKRIIPPRDLAMIGSHSIDVFPWDTEYLTENHLNYQPRPLFQSQTVMNVIGAEINYRHYTNHAPDFVFYDYDAIDTRYPFNDETLVNLFLLKNYFIADTFTSNERYRLLLRKKDTTHPLVFHLTDTRKLHLHDTIPTLGHAFIKVLVHTNPNGFMKSIWRHGPAVTMLIHTSGPEELRYRTSVEVLKQGIFTDRVVLSTRDFELLFQHKGNLQRLTSFALEADARYFEDAITVEYYTVE